MQNYSLQGGPNLQKQHPGSALGQMQNYSLQGGPNLQQQHPGSALGQMQNYSLQGGHIYPSNGHIYY
jgi:hypothetical protein